MALSFFCSVQALQGPVLFRAQCAVCACGVVRPLQRKTKALDVDVPKAIDVVVGLRKPYPPSNKHGSGTWPLARLYSTSMIVSGRVFSNVVLRLLLLLLSLASALRNDCRWLLGLHETSHRPAIHNLWPDPLRPEKGRGQTQHSNLEPFKKGVSPDWH